MAAGSAVAFFSLSAIALLCLCHHLLLPDPAAAAGPAVVVARAHRRGRAGRHHHHHHASSSPSSSNIINGPSSSSGIPDIKTFRDMLDRLPADDWSWSDNLDGPLDRYFGPDAPLGVRESLVYLFAILDRSPKDGGVSLAELEAWLLRQAAARLQAVARREMARHDSDGDGVVKLHEYIEHGKSWGWLHKFASADADGDGSLNAAEFNDFLHPEDSSQDKVQLWLLEHKLSEMDHDGDGGLSMEEFIDQSHVFDHHISVAHHEDEGDHGLARAEAEKKFRELDADMDNYLTVEEARPVIQSLLTGEFSYATSHAKLLMKADSDKDGKLSLEEMLNDYTSFYNIVYMDDHHYDDDDDVDGGSRDEL